MLVRPAESEIPAFFRGYVDAVPEGGLIEIMAGQLESFPALLRRFPESRTEEGYAPGKWSLKQSIEHVNDAERIFTYRMLRIARGDRTPLPGFEQDDYVANSRANARPWSEVIAEFEAVRRSTLALVRSLPDEAWLRTGTSSGAHSSARMFAHVIVGHVVHHARLIESKYAPLLK
jgi:hypothetical protein